MAQITGEALTLGYDGKAVLRDLNFTVEAGDYLCIVGENGSGKSTLIKGILGLLKPTGGTLTVAEELKKSGIGYLPQQTAAQRDFPAAVWEVVLSGCLKRRQNRPFYSAAERELAKLNMEKLGITDLKDQCYRELSGGQQQRVLIARALCATDKLLILDEPITGLDPSAIQDFYHLVERLNKKDGVAIVMVTHDLKNVLPYASKILHLKQRTVFYGAPAEYEESPEGREFLGGGRT